MNFMRSIFAFLAVTGFALQPQTGYAQTATFNEEVARSIAPVQRRQLENLAALSLPSLTEIQERVAPDALRSRVAELEQLGSLAIGTRPVDANGRSPIHHYLLNSLDAMRPHGVEVVGTVRGNVAVPVLWHNSSVAANRGPKMSLTVDGQEFNALPIWPNGAIPSITPKAGLTGPLVDVRRADWDDLRGIDLTGAIALMDFAGGRRIERLFSLGVIAVIVAEDNFVNVTNGHLLFQNTPLPFPRFYVDAQAAADLRGKIASAHAGGRTAQAFLRGGHIFEERPYESIFAYLPARDPLRVEVTPSLLLDLIAGDFNLRAEDLTLVNNLVNPVLSAGQTLLIPGGRGTYTVSRDDLTQRLARMYGNSVAELRSLNNLGNEDPSVGTVLTLPNPQGPLVVVVPIDSTSVVPDAPHGAQVRANLAAALAMLEHVATSSMAQRRRDLLIVFLDGDTIGGVGSRTFAEFTFLQNNRFTTGTIRDGSDQLSFYRESAQWFEDGSAPATTAYARQLADDWLYTRVETVRVELAERRIPLVIALNAADNPGERAALQAQLDAIGSELNYIIDFRNRTLTSRDPLSVRLMNFFVEAGTTGSERLRGYGISLEQLKERFLLELAEEETRQTIQEHNLANVARILEVINPGFQRGENRFRMGWYLDLSGSGTNIGISELQPGLTIRTANLRIGVQRNRIASRMRAVSAFAAANVGWAEQFNFVAAEDAAVFTGVRPRAPALYDEFWAFGFVGLVPISAANDSMPYLDTPWDVERFISFDDLSIQARTALTLLKSTLESPLDGQVDQNITRPDLGRITGRTVQFNIRSGIDAQDPIPGSYVFLPFFPREAHWSMPNSGAIPGFRRGVVMTTQLNGGFVGPVENITFNPRPFIFAYQMDFTTGLVGRVMNQGQVGTRIQDTSFVYRRGMETERNLVMIEAYPLVIFPGPDPHTHQPIGGSNRAKVPMTLVDAVINGEPREFGVANPFVHFQENNTDAVVIFMPQGKRVRAVVQRGMDYRMLLVGPVAVDRGRARGQGHLVGPRADGDPNVFMPFTPVVIADEMLQLAQHRLDIFRRYGISSQVLQDAVSRSADLHAQAVQALDEKDYQGAIGLARESWGILVKNYPRILKLGREAVFSSILLMALLVPAAYFLEKLLVGSKGIVRQLAWTTVIFTLGTLYLNAFHPAFRIAVSPFIVVIAFVMILMSVIVLSICYQRFEVILRRARAAGGEIESEEISLMSSLGTALSLGVSNLKKRMFRTVLTTLTVTALTFSIVAFVAVTGSDTVQRRAMPVDTFLDGERIDPIAPKFEGILFRNYQWTVMSEELLNVYETEFGRELEVTARAHFLQVEGGNNAFREGVNQIPLRHHDRAHIITGIMAFMPNEVEFSQLHRAVSHEFWFLPERTGPDGFIPADRRVVIIPDVAAATLGIEPQHLVDNEGQRLPVDQLPLITMSSREWRVIGILNTEHANRIRDINGRSLAMVDYLRSGFSPAIGGKLEDEGESYHMNWQHLAIIPFADRNDVRATLRSVAIRFDDDLNREQFFHDIALRIQNPFFAFEDGQVSFILPVQKVNMAGVAKVFLPVILCILIVMNTMLGAVEERRGEVSMLGAIGLSPKQISFLMLSEATVFSILGILFGTFGGLLFANIILGLNDAGISILSGLSFNFTSMISMVLAMGTGLVVLMATLIPAKQAAALAAPSGMSQWELPPTESDGSIRFKLPFTLTRGNAVGMAAFFEKYLLNHTDSTSEDYNAKNITLGEIEAADGRPGLAITADMWLTPYDLDVSQQLDMRFEPTDTEGVYAVEIILRRYSGTEENWLRTNYNFLNLVRQQFLLWRNLEQEARNQFIEQGIEAVTR